MDVLEQGLDQLRMVFAMDVEIGSYTEGGAFAPDQRRM